MTQKVDAKDFIRVSVFDILQNVNETLESRGKKPVTVGSVLSNLHKVVRYLQAAFGICLIINRQDETGMTVKIRNGVETQETINKYMEKALKPLIKVAKQVDHAISIGYPVESLTGDEQQACKLLASSSK